ncbi:MAG: hypothetical protein ABWZ27_09470 [Aestuariivirgaceae bacterium]
MPNKRFQDLLVFNLNQPMARVVRFIDRSMSALHAPGGQGGTNPMQVTQAAQIFHDWAYQEGMLDDGPTSPLQSSPAEIAMIGPITDDGRQLLRSKRVRAIGIDEPNNQIIVFTRLGAPRSAKAMNTLPAGSVNTLVDSDNHGKYIRVLVDPQHWKSFRSPSDRFQGFRVTIELKGVAVAHAD